MFEDSILEGFICPSCLASFGQVVALEEHFHKEHSLHVENTHFSVSINNVSKSGQSRNHTSEFIQLRRHQIEKASLEMNILLVRLEKLTAIYEITDEKKRIALEQRVVPWIGENANHCPRCGISFGLSLHGEEKVPVNVLMKNTCRRSFKYRAKMKLESASRLATALLDSSSVYRRRHHCRLCGHVICADCSCFFDVALAERLVSAHRLQGLSPANRRRNLLLDLIPTDSPEETTSRDSATAPDEMDSLSVLSKTLSLNSANPRKNYSRTFRICDVCTSFLNQNMQKFEDNSSSPIIIKIYQKLKTEMSIVNEKMPFYRSMANSLSLGEEKYGLEMAKNLRFTLLQSIQKIDALGKEIGCLPESAIMVPSESLVGGSETGSSASRMIRSLTTFCKRFVQLNLGPLQLLPTEAEHRQLVENRNQPKDLEATVTGDGWMPTPTFSSQDAIRLAETEDLKGILIRQIDFVSDCFRQAKQSNRSPDEISSLADNLSDLESELERVCLAMQH